MGALLATDGAEAGETPPSGAPIPPLFALICCLLCLAVMWAHLSERWVAHLSAATLCVIFCVAGVRRFGLRERVLLALALAVTAYALWQPQPQSWRPIVEFLSRGAFLAAFMMLMSSLREGAFRSRSVLEIGRYLTNQPPSRRYIPLHLGGHFMGTLLNFSAISLLGPLILRGARAAQAPGSPPALYDIRLRRQISALSRGFSWFNLWAPTAIAQAVVLTTVPGSRAGIIAPLGLTIAFITLWVGWGEDRVTGYRARMRLAEQGFKVSPAEAPSFPAQSLVRFLAVAAGLLGLAAVVYSVSSIPFVSAIMIAAVPLTALWMTVQFVTASEPPTEPLSGRLWQLIRTAVPSGSPEAATLGLAGFIGLSAASLVSPQTMAKALPLSGTAPAVIYIAITAIIPLASCIGLPPMMMVTFIGAILVSVPELGLNPSLLGLSLLVGWSLNLTGSPLGATSLLLSRVVGISGILHAWRWNGLFTVLSWVVAACVLLAATGLLG